jgi:glycosyltransferase involved in cell wall biosynthesis
MASGVPVLAMNAGGVRTIVEHDKTGLLANSMEEFGKFLDRLVEDAPFRSQIGMNGRRTAECKTWVHAFEYLENSYEQVLSEGGCH